jgi:predicted CXXCH cytochrome family protein
LISCSPQSKHDTLSVFFDGVPDPNAVNKIDSVQVASIDSLALPDPNRIFEKEFKHQPFADNSCDNCHDQSNSNKLLEKQPNLCYQCHDDYSKKYKVVHGPAASGYCTGCHEPHSSPNEKLIVSDGQKLCYNCHDKTDVMNNEIHQTIDETKCWDCHDPHGGSDRTFLK